MEEFHQKSTESLGDGSTRHKGRHIQADRITVEERVYEGEFDDVKTDAGERQVPFDRRGLMKSEWTRSPAL